MKVVNIILVKLIIIYQKTLSPDHGLFAAKYPFGYCRHYPSCSQYAVEALNRYSLSKSLFLITKRLFICNPFVSPKINHP